MNELEKTPLCDLNDFTARLRAAKTVLLLLHSADIEIGRLMDTLEVLDEASRQIELVALEKYREMRKEAYSKHKERFS